MTKSFCQWLPHEGEAPPVRKLVVMRSASIRRRLLIPPSPPRGILIRRSHLNFFISSFLHSFIQKRYLRWIMTRLIPPSVRTGVPSPTRGRLGNRLFICRSTVEVSSQRHLPTASPRWGSSTSAHTGSDEVGFNPAKPPYSLVSAARNFNPAKPPLSRLPPRWVTKCPRGIE